MKRLKDRGLWYFDPDFDGDEEDHGSCQNLQLTKRLFTISIFIFKSNSMAFVQEIYYYLNAGNEVKREDITSEGVSLKVSEAGNKELAESLTFEGGPLQCGALPDADAATDAGKKSLVESITNAGAAVAKAKPQKREPSEKVEPKSLLESEAQSLCDLGKVKIDSHRMFKTYC